jgi:23S rRNA (guanosine2251-2'-O)-methyltransferase
MQKLKNKELNRISTYEYKNSIKTPIVVILDNVRSMNNIGSAFRTADAFRIEKIILTGITAKPPHREINKTALGATESVPWEYSEDTTVTISKLHKEGYQVVAIEQAQESIMLHDFTVEAQTKYALVFGNEVKGVSSEVMKQVDSCIEIPQKGSKHSFNISVSIGITLWDLANKLRIF